MGDFVTEARRKAAEHGVDRLCRFETGDVNRFVDLERGWDCVLLSAAGNVLGTPEEMLEKLAGVVRTGGYILLDEGYLAGEETQMQWAYESMTFAAWQALFAAQGLTLLARERQDMAAATARDREDMAAIQRRAAELCEKFPAKRALFEGYVASQQAEVEDIEGEGFVNESWLLQK